MRRIRFHGGWRRLVEARSTDLDLRADGVRIFFSPSVRMSAEATRWASDNFLAAHVVERHAATSVELEIDPAWEWNILSVPVHALAELEVEAGAPAEVTFELMDGLIVPARAKVRPGRVTFHFQNCTEEAELLALVAHFERDDEEEDAAEEGDDDEAAEGDEPWMTWRPILSGKRLLSTQSFRELFRAETLPPDATLELQSLSLLFTDLRASTQLYERIGDLRALALVREHFKILRDVIDEEEGAVVKTIGDAVMATFVEPERAARAGARMHRALERLAPPSELALKVGVHTGPCVVIDSNGRLDYFGQTVNVAARVQGLAEGRELVVTDTLYQAPGVREALRALDVPLAREEAHLKGIDSPVVVHRGLVP